MYRTHYRQYLSILVIVTVRHYYNIDIGNKLTAKWDWKLVLQRNCYCFAASRGCSHLFDLTIGFLLDEQIAKGYSKIVQLFYPYGGWRNHPQYRCDGITRSKMSQGFCQQIILVHICTESDQLKTKWNWGEKKCLSSWNPYLLFVICGLWQKCTLNFLLEII